MAATPSRRQSKAEVITLKADAALVEALRHVPNRSAFIRAAVLNALESTCPLCQGTGVLTPPQKAHWDAFTRDHPLQECSHCNELRIVCRSDRTKPAAGPRRRRQRDGRAAS